MTLALVEPCITEIIVSHNRVLRFSKNSDPYLKPHLTLIYIIAYYVALEKSRLTCLFNTSSHKFRISLRVKGNENFLVRQKSRYIIVFIFLIGEK